MSVKNVAGRGRKRGIAGIFQEFGRNRVLYLMLFPAVLFFAIFAYVPMVGIYYAFTNFNYEGGLFFSPFIGLKNFQYLFHGGLESPVWKLTKNTILYNIVFIFAGNALQCMFAILITEISGRTFKRFSQSAMLLPYFVSYVIVGTIAYNIFNYEFGALNGFLRSLGQPPFDTYGTPGVWPFILVFFNLWKGLGYGTVIYLAAIMGIDREIYEAAKIDGCDVMQEIFFITLVLFSLGGIMRGQFELFYQLVGRNGLLFPVTDIIDTYIYRSLTINFNIGLSTAAGLYQSVFGLITVLLTNGWIHRNNPESALF